MSRFDRRAWLLPVVFAAHVAEEAPGFTDWARRHASERYTQADFLRNNAAGLALTAGARSQPGRSPQGPSMPRSWRARCSSSVSAARLRLRIRACARRPGWPTSP